MSTKVFDQVLTELPSLDGDGDVPAKVIVITGTTSGTGFEAAKVCAELGATVLLLNRKSERATKSLEQLKAGVPNGNFVPIECDLQSFASVNKAIDEIKSKYDALYCLANNAGIMAFADKATEDGYDIQMQVNQLSPFLLTTKLFPLLEAGGERWGQAKVVSHTSVLRYGPPLESKFLEKNGGKLGGNSSKQSFSRYHQTKLANIIFTCALADRLEKSQSKVISISAHPGVASTSLSNNMINDGGVSKIIFKSLRFLGLLGAQSQKDGTAGILKCIASDKLVNKDFLGPAGTASGKGRKGYPNKLPHEDLWDNTETKDLLWQACEAATGSFSIN